MLQDRYSWEIELNNNKIITEGNNFDPLSVVRFSFVPNNILFPRHDLVFINGINFEKRFTRNFMKIEKGFIECVHIVITNKFRFHLFSSVGRTLITEKNYEFYV